MFNYEKAYKNALKRHEKRCKKYGYKSDFSWRLRYYKRLQIFKQSNGRVTFDSKTIEARSYNHWCFVKVIKNKVVFNWHSYSNTTRKHQYDVSSLLSQLGIKVDVQVYQRQSLDNGIKLDRLYSQIYNIEIAANRKGARNKTKEYALKDINAVKKEIAALKKLGARIEPNKILQIKKDCFENECYRLEKVKKKYEQWKIDNAELIQQRKLEKKLKRESEKFHNMINEAA